MKQTFAKSCKLFYKNGYNKFGGTNAEGGGPQPISWKSAIELGRKLNELWKSYVPVKPTCKLFWVGIGFAEELGVISKLLEKEDHGVKCDVIGIDLKDDVIQEAQDIVSKLKGNVQCTARQGDAMKLSYKDMAEEDFDIIYTSAEINEIFCTTYFYFGLISPTVKYIICPTSFWNYTKTFYDHAKWELLLTGHLDGSKEVRRIYKIDVSDKDNASTVQEVKEFIIDYYKIKEKQCFISFVENKTQFEAYKNLIMELIQSVYSNQNITVVLPTPTYMADIGSSYTYQITTSNLVENVGIPFAQNCTNDYEINNYWKATMKYIMPSYHNALVNLLQDRLNIDLESGPSM